MPEPTPIALTQLALWYDPTRIQTWPSFLASLPEGTVASTPTDLGRSFATDRMTSHRHAAAFNLVRNLPGLEMRGRCLQLRGVGLIERMDSGYGVSDLGKALRSAYAVDPGGTDWLRLLSDALLGREPRTRALVKLLSVPNSTLVFERDGWFDGSYRCARLECPGEPVLFPLDAAADRRTLRAVLTEDAWWCLGDWRRDRQLHGATACRFCNTRGGPFSLHDIGLAMRAACEALLVTGLLHSQGGTARFDTATAATLLPDRGADFGWVQDRGEAADVMEALAEVLPSLRSTTGHVVASELREVLRDLGVSDPDHAIAEAERSGRLLVYAEDYGQSRHGPGLYGDPRKQLVKLRIVGGGAQA